MASVDLAAERRLGCAVCGAIPRSRAEKCNSECPMTPERAALMEIVRQEIEIASLPGTFSYGEFAEAMKLRAPDVLAREHFCVICGMPARFATSWSGKDGREGIWTCLEHRGRPVGLGS